MGAYISIKTGDYDEGEEKPKNNYINMLYIILAVIAVLAVIYFIVSNVGLAVILEEMNLFGSSNQEYNIADAFGIVN